MGMLTGAYRRSWYRNQFLFDAAAKLIDQLAAAGVPVLVIKGAALCTLHYRDIGARPMDDVDMLVAPEHARLAMDHGFHDWAAFSAQQSAEKAAKAVLNRLGAEAWGHSVTDLLDGLAGAVPVPHEIAAPAAKDNSSGSGTNVKAGNFR